MKTLDNEQLLLDIYRTIPSSSVVYFGRFFSCLRVELLTKSLLFSKSWINSSAKNTPPPDFHNKKHKIMMEFMRVDDCINKIKGKHVANSFERSNKLAKNLFGKDFKHEDCVLFTLPNTTNSEEFNFKGYTKNFEKVVLKHADKVENYRKN